MSTTTAVLLAVLIGLFLGAVIVYIVFVWAGKDILR